MQSDRSSRKRRRGDLQSETSAKFFALQKPFNANQKRVCGVPTKKVEVTKNNIARNAAVVSPLQSKRQQKV
jgi:hypothetical protein